LSGNKSTAKKILNTPNPHAETSKIGSRETSTFFYAYVWIDE
jgi:hypothetical protein